MKIKYFNNDPICTFPFLNAGWGPDSFYVDQLPVHVGQVTSLPKGIDAIIATADLQGREQFKKTVAGPPRLLGEVLPDQLCNMLPSLGVSPERTGVILAGDFYTVPNLDRRGGTGNVNSVWRAFASKFKWIVGVAGNHDTFGSSLAPRSRIAPNANYLDGNDVVLDGLRIAGLGGIIGNPQKPHRKTDQDFAGKLDSMLRAEPDILVLHDGPDDTVQGQKGSPIIRQTVERYEETRYEETLLIRGHSEWAQPLALLANDTQVLNVHCRVAILYR
ncbi:MAG: metallophosphoesterase [Pirellulaceae bacterium]|nr:metallophosphoesterase [Pirellulaceae bacterium]